MSSGVESPPADAGAPSTTGSRLNQLGLFVLLVAVALLIAYLLISLVLVLLGTTPGVSVAACIANQPVGHVTGPPLQPASPPVDPPFIHWSGLVILACVAGFVLGDAWGRRRALGQTATTDQYDGTLGPPDTLLQTVLVAMLMGGVGALVWETFALARVQDQPDLWPITFYIRCANDVLSLPTLVGGVLVSTMVGHFLGYQAKAGEPD
ncbi:MAG TPA: hypothetical protein VOB72_19240 [Candidatus Dormibacteraeota bacterium]|nr:hypothetical protein [Candidatus Dormibacteraeota bacterium]